MRKGWHARTWSRVADLVMKVFAFDVCFAILLRCTNVEFASSSSLILVQVGPAQWHVVLRGSFL